MCIRDRFEAANRANPSANAFPPYNIEKQGEDAYRVTMAVAGFGEADIDVTVQENLLVISGKLTAGDAAANVTDNGSYLHRGIANRAFERRFNLSEHVVVTDASLANGLLVVNLVREIPEAKKPRRIEILAGKTIENKKAA